MYAHAKQVFSVVKLSTIILQKLVSCFSSSGNSKHVSYRKQKPGDQPSISFHYHQLLSLGPHSSTIYNFIFIFAYLSGNIVGYMHQYIIHSILCNKMSTC